MADRKRKSGFRSWAINGCFLASGLMIGLKGGQSKQSDAPATEDPAQVALDVSKATVSPTDPTESTGSVTKADFSSSAEVDTKSEWQPRPKSDPDTLASTDNEPLSADDSPDDAKGDGEPRNERASDIAAKKSGVLTEDEMVVRKRLIATPQEQVAETTEIDSNKPRVEKTKVEKADRSMPTKEPVAANATRKPVIDSRPARGDKVASPQTTDNDIAATQNVAAPQPKTADRKTEKASGKPAYRIETIPMGAVEVINVRPATAKNAPPSETVRPVSATQRAPSQRQPESASRREERAKAVKDVENELERLQRALRELQNPSSPSSSSTRR